MRAQNKVDMHMRNQLGVPVAPPKNPEPASGSQEQLLGGAIQILVCFRENAPEVNLDSSQPNRPLNTRWPGEGSKPLLELQARCGFSMPK